jgi:hypothetical protein
MPHSRRRPCLAPSCTALAGVFTIVLLALGGCASYRAPALEISRIRLVEETPAGLVLNFDIDARNDNEVELPLREVRYTVRLHGAEGAGSETIVFSGIRSPEASLRRLGTQRITFPAAIAIDTPSAPAVRGGAERRPTGIVRYTVEGELHYITPGQIAQILFDLNVRRPRVYFRDEGMVDLGV